MKECHLCGKEVEKYHRKYKGQGYCSTCYAYLFKKKACSQCDEDKRIYRYLDPPVCQQCDLKDKPCIRCGKTKFSLGKITEDGPVCNSCSTYYRPKKKCSICGKEQRNVSRRLRYGELEPICEKCFNKRHFVTCHHCKQRSAPFLFDLKKQAYCKPCTTKHNKNCLKCASSLPAGHHSNTCKNCYAIARIKRIIQGRKQELNPEVFELYSHYSKWLLNRRGAPFASRQIIRDFEIFEFLEDWMNNNNKWPSYYEYAHVLTVSKTRKHLLATTFLDEYGVFSISERTKSEIGNLNTIDRLIKKISINSALRPYIDGYYKIMQDQYNSGKTSARSFRLAITPAVSMLELGLSQRKIQPDNELIKQYLWLHYGQRAAITGFINYLKRSKLNIEIPPLDSFRFIKPKESKIRLKQQLIQNLRQINADRSTYIKVGIQYFHNIKIPDEIKPILSISTTSDSKWFYLKLMGEVILIPHPNTINRNH